MTEKTQIIITAKDETRAAFQSVQSGLAGLEKSAIGLGPIFAGLGAALSVGAFTQTITNTIKFAAALDDMAEKTGASVENLSALAGVAKVGGHDIGMVESSLVKLAKAIQGTGEESKPAAAALEAIGLSAEKLRSLDTAEAMLQVAKALDQFRDGSGKTAAAVALLGKSGADALPFLKDLAEQSELVGRVSAEQSAQAEQYEKNLNKLAASFGAAGKAAAYELLPFLEKLTSEMVAARDNSASFASVFGEGVRTALESVAVLGVNVVYVFKQIGNEIGGIAAQAVALAKLDFKGAGFIGDAMKEDAARARAEVDKLSADLLDRSKKAGEKAEIKPALKFAAPAVAAPRARGGGGGRSRIDEAERLIASLNEQIALKAIDAESTDKMTAAEQQRARVLYQIDAGTLKVTASQREKIAALLDEAIVLDRALQAQKEFADGVKRLDEANAKSRQSLIEQAAAARESAATYGLSATAINSTVEARLEEAIAVANANGAYPEQIAYLEEELALRQQLTGALEKNDLARLLANTKTAKDAKTAADVATLDRALSSGKINKDQYDEAMDNIKEKFDEMGEFAKQAARNMQDAFADFLFDPFSQGLDKALYKFVQTIQRMAAEAVAANILKALFGDMGKTGQVGGLVGSFITSFGFHEGGLVGEPGGASFTRAVPASLFANARRYHTGGIAGDEVPAILKKGELVLTKEQQRGMVAAPAPAQPQNIRIINAFDQSVIGDYLGSAAGERIIMNAVQRNASAMRQALA